MAIVFGSVSSQGRRLIEGARRGPPLPSRALTDEQNRTSFSRDPFTELGEFRQKLHTTASAPGGDHPRLTVYPGTVKTL